MKKILLFLTLLIASSYFFFTGSYALPTAKDVWTFSGNDNQLTDAEKKEGWKLLFNGQNLDGWRTYQEKPGSWSVADGAIYCHKMEDHHYADLITDKEYESFEISVDWKMEPKANSGILYLVTEQYPETYLSGPEYQLMDDAGYAGKVEDFQKCGANYAMQAPVVNAANPPGEWNHTVIIKNKAHVEHWLNGKKVVEYELWSDEWKKQKAADKWKDAEGYGAAKAGHIAFQDYHGDGKVWFKNVKIKVL